MSAAVGSRAIEARAAHFRQPGQISVARVRVPAPGPGEVRVRLEGCGVCASNLPVWEGRPWFNYPLTPGAPGHEGWGTVDCVGEGVTDVVVGDRVAFLSYNAYAEYDIAAAETVVKLPPELAGRPFPGEPLACVMNIFRRSDIRPGQTVAIVGTGFIGAALTALAARSGARVIALSRRTCALEMAERFGAQALIPFNDPAKALEEARREIGESGCERVIEAVGTQQALDVATELTGTRAKLVIAGYHQDGSRQVNLQLWNWRGLDVINAHERDASEYRRGMQEAVDLVASGGFDPAPLFTHRFALDETQLAFDTLARRPQGFMKALITCA
jgi:threonine dehydrogenase-like Zn-dependent dehydrogenase